MMKLRLLPKFLAALLLTNAVFASGSAHVAYHSHLHQPIYWPEVNANGSENNRHRFAADVIALKQGNTGNHYPARPVNIRAILPSETATMIYVISFAPD